MSSRPQFNPTIVVSPVASPKAPTGDMSGNITSLPTIVQKLSMISYAVKWVGTTPVGTISVQVSNDYSQNADGTVLNAGTWNTITFEYNGATATTVPVSGNTGNGFIDIDATAAYAIRLIYTRASGTGAMTVVVNGKVA